MAPQMRPVQTCALVNPTQNREDYSAIVDRSHVNKASVFVWISIQGQSYIVPWLVCSKCIIFRAPFYLDRGRALLLPSEPLEITSTIVKSRSTGYPVCAAAGLTYKCILDLAINVCYTGQPVLCQNPSFNNSNQLSCKVGS